MVRRRFRPLIALAVVVAAAGSVTAAGLTFTAHTVSRTVAELPEIKPGTLPSYVVRMPEPRTVDVAAVEAPVATPAAPAPAPVATLVAEVTPLSAETIAEPEPAGATYIVSSDVFVRSGPSTSYAQEATARGGTEVSVTAQEGGWMKVSYAGGNGWIYGRYLTPATSEVAEVETGSAPF